jgi:transposase
MLNEIGVSQVYLACGVTDLRKSIDGLAVLVREVFELDPFSSYLFVFCNRKQDKLKILTWEHNGFWLYYRRLEKGRFQRPKHSGQKVAVISRRELHFLLSGLSLYQAHAHREVTARVVL